LGRGVQGIRIGVPQNYFFDRTSPEVKAMVLRAIDQLAALGAEVHEVQIPSLDHIGLARAASGTESALYLLPFARQGPSAFADESIWERVVLHQFVRRTHAMKAAQVLNLIRREFLDVMEGMDILATPTTVSPAFPIGEPESSLEEDASTTATRLTFPFNFVGMPAVSVPCGLSAEGLPVGLMLAGRHWEDDLVLQVAFAYEQAATGGYALPPIMP
jgi:aspartyl-tRNA(Asn)/glutamyl-tRNA(Gln) amidotransferase subunit A